MKTLNELIETYGIDKLNTFTKYPSILTYHDLGERGSLVESLVEGKDFQNIDKCYLTEKIDGTNSRVVIWNHDYLIGSRENFLYGKGDRIGDPTLNIVNTLKDTANIISDDASTEFLYVLYGETYGGNITANSKQYTNDKSYGFRMFDFTMMTIDEVETILNKPIENIASWREHDGKRFANVNQIQNYAKLYNFETVPYINVVNGNTIPTTLKEVFEWLQQFAVTKAGINNTGHAEGVVVRNFDRSLIRKIRFEDYERTKKRNLF